MQENELTFQFLSEPSDVNFGGNVHGGMVMKWIDQAAYACACNWSNTYCVTVYVGGIRFYRPIGIGNVVKVKTKIIYTGKTSMHIAVDVFSKAVSADEFIQTTHCIIVFVAVDEQGNPTSIKNWAPQTEQEKKMEEYAIRLMELRTGIEKEMEPYLTPKE